MNKLKHRSKFTPVYVHSKTPTMENTEDSARVTKNVKQTGTDQEISTKEPPQSSSLQLSSNGNGNKRRNSSGHKSRGSKKSKKNERTHVTRKEDDTIHLGSFAHPTMQALFNLAVPNYPPQSSPSLSETSKKATSSTSEQNDPCTKSTSEANDGASESTKVSAEQSSDTLQKFPKRKIVLFIGFIGKSFSGMQMNKDKDTIQARLELALFNANMIAASNFGLPNRYSWSNAARTDKGVHSCAQVCSVKIQLSTDSMDKVRNQINEQLPSDIRVLDCKRASRTFCAKTARDKVRYQYMIPSFILQENQHIVKVLETVTKGCEFVNERNPERANCRGVANGLTDSELDELSLRFSSCRATEDQLSKLARNLKAFEGTKNHHNYTSGKQANDPSTNRYIHSFKVCDAVVDPYGVEWIPTQVVGQSFLFNQIRKMISMVVDVVRGAADEETFRKSFEKDKMSVNVAPAQGLFLDMSYYELLNKRNANNQSSNAPLDWSSDESDPAHQRWKDFKETKVLPHIMEEEHTERNFIKYLFHQEYVFGRRNPYTPPIHHAER